MTEITRLMRRRENINYLLENVSDETKREHLSVELKIIDKKIYHIFVETSETTQENKSSLDKLSDTVSAQTSKIITLGKEVVNNIKKVSVYTQRKQYKKNTQVEKEAVKRQKHIGTLRIKHRLKSLAARKLFRLNPMKSVDAIERNIHALEEERAYWEDRILKFSNKLFVLSLKGSRNAELIYAKKRIKQIEALLVKNEQRLAQKTRSLGNRAKKLLYGITGSRKLIKVHTKEEIKELKNDYKSAIKSLKNKKNTKKTNQEAIIEVLEAKEKHSKKLSKDEKTNVKTQKEILNVDKKIYTEVKRIREDMIDEQDTSIKKVSHGSLEQIVQKAQAGTLTKKDENAWVGPLIAGAVAGMAWNMFNDWLNSLAPQDKDKAKIQLKEAISAPKGTKLGLKTAYHGTKTLSKGAEKIGGKIAEKIAQKRAPKTTAQAKNAMKALKNASVNGIKPQGTPKTNAKYHIPKGSEEFAKKASKTSKKAKNATKVAQELSGKYKFFRKPGETTEKLAGRIMKFVVKKNALKMALKKVPALGTVAAVGLAVMRFNEGDYTGGILEITSGILSLFPGIGTAGSVGVDMYLIIRDVKAYVAEVEAQEAKDKAQDELRARKIANLAMDKRLSSDGVYASLKAQSMKDAQAFKDAGASGMDKTSQEYKTLAKKHLNSYNALKQRKKELTKTMGDGAMLTKFKREEEKIASKSTSVLKSDQMRILKEMQTIRQNGGVGSEAYNKKMQELTVVGDKIATLNKSFEFNAKMRLKKFKEEYIKSATEEVNKKYAEGSVKRYKKYGYNLNKLRQDLTVDEDAKLKPYSDTGGKMTVGIGHLLLESGGLSTKSIIGREITSSDTITPKEMYDIFEWDISRIANELYQKLPWISNLPESVQRALVNMAFNMGVGSVNSGRGLLGFTNFLSYIKSGDFRGSIPHLLDSDWAKQVKGRSQRIAKRILQGEGKSAPISKSFLRKHSKVSSKNSTLKNMAIIAGEGITGAKQNANTVSSMYNKGSDMVSSFTGGAMNLGKMGKFNVEEIQDSEKSGGGTMKRASTQYHSTSMFNFKHPEIGFTGLTPDTKKAILLLGSMVKKRLTITSAFRSPAYNNHLIEEAKKKHEIPPVKNSQHTKGRALDVNWVPGLSKAEFITLAQRAGFTGGMGTYNSFLHMDTRNGFANWSHGGGITVNELIAIRQNAGSVEKITPERQQYIDSKSYDNTKNTSLVSVNKQKNNTQDSSDVGESKAKESFPTASVNPNAKESLISASSKNLNKTTKTFNERTLVTVKGLNDSKASNVINNTKAENTNILDVFGEAVEGII